MTTWVSGWACRSRSSLRLGASEGESEALLGKGSGSRGQVRKSRPCRMRLTRRKRTEQAVTLKAGNGDRQHLSDDVGRCHDMRRLQIGGAADDLARLARGALEQHIDGAANRRRIEGRL